jgi:hypothetical protein
MAWFGWIVSVAASGPGCRRYGPSISIGGLAVSVSAKCESDKSEHNQDGARYHHPVRILER